jgi:predicted Zn-dependent protease
METTLLTADQKYGDYMRRSRALLVFSALAITGFAYVIQSTPQLPDPGNTGVSKEQQEQLGQQTAAEVYKQMPVLPDSSAETQYVQQLGRKLVSVIPPETSWPYQFHVVPQKEINAFALPGGPIFVNIGTITAAQNEAQLAGVMAHEISHVYMQHSIKQLKKQQLQQGLVGILGAVLGQSGGAAASLARIGIGIGSGMLSLKYSRGDEAQADSVGAILMYKVGYPPVELAEFFQTLEQQGGANGPNFLSDHPNPGNRVAAIEQEVRGWPPVNTQVNNQAFARVKERAQGVRAYTAQEIAQGAKDNTWARQNERYAPKN